MSELEILEKLAREHRDATSHRTWRELARKLQDHPLGTGATWTRQRGGRSYDVGDTIEWLSMIGGDIRHRFYATEDPAIEDARTVSFARVITRPDEFVNIISALGYLP